MKKSFAFLPSVLSLSLLAMLLISCSPEEIQPNVNPMTSNTPNSPGPDYILISNSDLPSEINDFINNAFPGQGIESAWMDDDGFEIFLENGIELNFDNDGVFLYADGSSNGNNSNEDYSQVGHNDLPDSLLEFLSNNYPDLAIASAWMDDDGYEIFLENGWELNFDLQGNFEYLDSSSDDDDYEEEEDYTEDDDYVQISPESLPSSILDFITNNYPGSTITSAWMDDDGYEVFLNNNVELNFDSNGNFLYAG
jgi:hypothetical protein